MWLGLMRLTFYISLDVIEPAFAEMIDTGRADEFIFGHGQFGGVQDEGFGLGAAQAAVEAD